ncbi:RagB/SusD family nutrient uptake outer membrane protein [Dyadobacter sp. LHD-138]|uniref:RagB/SusD family nutrient uptake outer membrane protein n=1 Tax=Dyadobacter sp. LHD-138 TaxID=3071413 RepID=UPI0027E15878|nr:RagB/SusD family nutrient uptake outer membrane protein [Dyadobacter sp. LHD-138]MDQ6481010.1 RagB/SusD family nutrient uptake outer membrane protein [Dyadobacter sp. LHD-138]
MKLISKYLNLKIAVLAIFMVSCSDNLDLKPTSVISNASFWKTEDNATGGLNGMYVNLRAQATKNLFLLGEARSETVGSGVQGLDGRDAYYLNQLNATNAGPNWQGMYTIVHHANLILKYVPDIPFSSEASKNNILAQAYAMRAYVYFCMVKTWGALPIVTEPTEDFSPEAIQKERAPVESVFALIKKDIDAAKDLFSNNSFAAGRNMWSKPALNALKGEVYLWTAKRLAGGQADFAVALGALNEVKAADVSLLDNYSSIFEYANKGNKEILLAVNFKQNEVTDNDYANMYFPATYIPKDMDSETSAALGVAAGLNTWAPAEAFRSQFTSDDQRKNGTFREIYSSVTGTRKFFGSFNVKFKGLINAGARLFLDDYVVYRYADVLLMIAEAKNAMSQDPAVEINLVRKRAYQTNFAMHEFVSGTKDANDEAILKERMLELGLEGKRWWDLLRFGKAFEKVASLKDRNTQDYLLLFPIPESTLSLESKVKQNPGYN